MLPKGAVCLSVCLYVCHTTNHHIRWVSKQYDAAKRSCLSVCLYVCHTTNHHIRWVSKQYDAATRNCHKANQPPLYVWFVLKTRNCQKCSFLNWARRWIQISVMFSNETNTYAYVHNKCLKQTITLFFRQPNTGKIVHVHPFCCLFPVKAPRSLQ